MNNDPTGQLAELSGNHEEERVPVNISVTEEFGIGFGGITAPEKTQAQAEHEAQSVAQYIVSVPKEAVAVCIDGRWGRILGAKLAGGYKTLAVAAKSIGYRLAGKALHEHAKSRGFNLGAHVDDTNEAVGFENGTGCGANDQEEKIDKLFSEHKESLMGFAKTLISVNGEFKENHFKELVLLKTTEDKNELRNTVDDVETLHDDGEGVHGHTEWAVLFNFIENTTLDRDAYISATGKKVFVVDMWYIKSLADDMAEGIDLVEQASKFYNAMVAYQLATYIALCDGKHRGIIATSDQEQQAA